MKGPAKAPGELVPQPHGGALKNGSRPGEHAGTHSIGRPASQLRERLRGSFADRIPVLEEIADSAEANASDRTRAIDVLAKYGLGEAKVDEGLVRELGAEMAEEVRELPGGNEALARIFERWKPVIARRL